MRDLIINKLAAFIAESSGYGIPCAFDCDESNFITDETSLHSMTNEELLEAFEATIGFGG